MPKRREKVKKRTEQSAEATPRPPVAFSRFGLGDGGKLASYNIQHRERPEGPWSISGVGMDERSSSHRRSGQSDRGGPDQPRTRQGLGVSRHRGKQAGRGNSEQYGRSGGVNKKPCRLEIKFFGSPEELGEH